MRLPVTLALFSIFAGEALASGGINCEAKDAAVAFDLGGGVTHGMGAPLFSFNGVLKVNDQTVAEDLAETTFALDHVAQYWLDGEELKLRLYRERDGSKPHGYVELGIVTTAKPGDDGEGVYDGDYTLNVFDTSNNDEGVTVTREGKVSCFVE